jgi:peptidoglycan/xylan/chitin deacetylase (PgdA/CDA1 family)
MGHGFVQMPMHSLEDQRGAISRTVEAITAFTGRRPRGWESPGLTETFDTIDFLAEEGIEYVADWVLDDQPCEIATDSGPIVSLPYPVEMNDVAMMAVGLHASDEWLKRGLRQFERLYQESASITRIMSISIHPYLTGVPHRIGYLEELLDVIAKREGVLFMTGEQILVWFLGQRTTTPHVQA